MIDAQLDIDSESASTFKDAFSKILDGASKNAKGKMLIATWIDTPLGPMLAIADEQYLYLLEFVGRKGLAREIERMRSRLKIGIISGNTKILDQIKQELSDYFKGALKTFKTPCYLLGSEFQKSVWQALQTIPYGKTCSYLDLSKKIGRDKAYRAVANANGANQLALIVPCHRVINANGELGGYGGGISRKAWLISHEQSLI